MLGAPFDLPGDDRGVLCIHGFTGTPFEVEYLGRRLHERGFTVVGPALPGHATSPEDLEGIRWQDWVSTVEDQFDALRARCRVVAVVGLSLGGLLALHLASRRREVAAVASLAAPLWLEGLGGVAARLTSPGGWLSSVRWLPKIGGSDVRDRRMARLNPGYRVIPTRALAQFIAFTHVADDALPAVSAPLLVIHARQDHTAPVASAARIASRAGAVRTRILPDSYHLISLDLERDIVAAEVAAFFTARTGRPNLAPPRRETQRHEER